jgi:predicted transcriptional regulator
LARPRSHHKDDASPLVVQSFTIPAWRKERLDHLARVTRRSQSAVITEALNVVLDQVKLPARRARGEDSDAED